MKKVSKQFTCNFETFPNSFQRKFHCKNRHDCFKLKQYWQAIISEGKGRIYTETTLEGCDKTAHFVNDGKLQLKKGGGDDVVHRFRSRDAPRKRAGHLAQTLLNLLYIQMNTKWKVNGLITWLLHYKRIAIEYL